MQHVGIFFVLVCHRTNLKQQERTLLLEWPADASGLSFILSQMQETEPQNWSGVQVNYEDFGLMSVNLK